LHLLRISHHRGERHRTYVLRAKRQRRRCTTAAPPQRRAASVRGPFQEIIGQSPSRLCALPNGFRFCATFPGTDHHPPHFARRYSTSPNCGETRRQARRLLWASRCPALLLSSLFPVTSVLPARSNPLRNNKVLDRIPFLCYLKTWDSRANSLWH